MTILTTTLAQLRKHRSCVRGYNRLVRALKGEPFTSEDEERTTHLRFTHKGEIPLSFILEANGLDDALWALRASNCSARDARLLAVAFAREVEHLMPKASHTALDVAEQFANGLATPDELAEACSAAYSASDDAYNDAYHDVYSDAYSASDDASDDAYNDAYHAAYAAYNDAYHAAYAAYSASDADASASAYYVAANVASAAYAAEEVRQRQTELFRQLCQGTTPWHTQP